MLHPLRSRQFYQKMINQITCLSYGGTEVFSQMSGNTDSNTVAKILTFLDTRKKIYLAISYSRLLMPLLLLRHQLKWRRSNYKITLFLRIQKILPWQLRHQMRQHPWHSWRWCSPPRVSTRVQVFCPNPTCRIPVRFSNLSYTELSQTCHLFQFLQSKN